MASLTIRRIFPPIITSRPRPHEGHPEGQVPPVRRSNSAVTVIRLAVVILTLAAVVAVVGAVRAGV